MCGSILLAWGIWQSEAGDNAIKQASIISST